MTGKKGSSSLRRAKREERHLVAAGRRLNGVWTVTTYLQGKAGRRRRGLFWQRAVSR